MDAKFSSEKSLNISGVTLLFVLGVGLGLSAVMLDFWFNYPTLLGHSISIPFCLSAIAAGCLGCWAVPLLSGLKAGQFIREDGPQAHLKKAGTPTMGGIFFIPVAVFLSLLLSRFDPQVVAVSGLTLAYMAIGWLDDWQVLRRRSNKGISPRTKLLLQISGAVIFCLYLVLTQASGLADPSFTGIQLPLGLTIPLGILFWPLAGFVLVAESNATNLTDGVDGLAAGTGAIAFLGLGAIVASTEPGLGIFCACLSGGCIGFLMHNRNPAQVFMGDTGSLAIGGALAATAVLSHNLFCLAVLSLVFIAETLSVIAQVSYFKATKGPDGVGKRLFRMAPLHHHLELGGWTETQVVSAFYGIGASFALLCMIIS